MSPHDKMIVNREASLCRSRGPAIGAASLIERPKPLHGQIYEILWEKILSGDILPGQRLSDVEWSARLNISRTPTREAMRKLEQDGILAPLAGGGYKLRRIEARELRNLYRCRAVLEALAIRDAAPYFSALDAERMRGLIAHTEEFILHYDFDAAFELNTLFHEQIIDLTKNPCLIRLTRNLGRLILFARSSLRNAISHSRELREVYARYMTERQNDHRQIVDLLVGGRVDEAAAAMERHLFMTAEDMLRISEQLPVHSQGKHQKVWGGRDRRQSKL
ncbi:MAG: GntR family transcriptional regulator [Acetobacteraceae bacterium]